MVPDVVLKLESPDTSTVAFNCSINDISVLRKSVSAILVELIIANKPLIRTTFVLIINFKVVKLTQT